MKIIDKRYRDVYDDPATGAGEKIKEVRKELAKENLLKIIEKRKRLKKREQKEGSIKNLIKTPYFFGMKMNP